ncbi:VOC family protein [Methylophilus aquaticus]|uniref:VOC family protein n=1 Tax=Methylophilus aquaticus TaxID=1971610 RepID=A0ABT9JQ83_9PROT|nr:VOC family protein [Methylophilus aquaticus]MDP8566719.1 VOC family protein [Methylophilus aquaticus]
MTIPAGMIGIRHVALFIKDLEAAVDFYTRIVGMQIEWQPDPDNVYLTNQGDVFALHRVEYKADPLQRLDHIGFVLSDAPSVDAWHAHMVAQGVRITEAPKSHRDGSRGFYCLDSVGHLLEFIYHPPIVRHGQLQT